MKEVRERRCFAPDEPALLPTVGDDSPAGLLPADDWLMTVSLPPLPLMLLPAPMLLLLLVLLLVLLQLRLLLLRLLSHRLETLAGKRAVGSPLTWTDNWPLGCCCCCSSCLASTAAMFKWRWFDPKLCPVNDWVCFDCLEMPTDSARDRERESGCGLA